MTGTLADVMRTLQEIKEAMLADDDERFMAALDVASSLVITPEQVRDAHDYTIRVAPTRFNLGRYNASQAYPNHA